MIEAPLCMHVMTENMNSERYKRVLEDHVCPLSLRHGDPSSEWTLMDDYAPPYRSLATRDEQESELRTGQLGHPI